MDRIEPLRHLAQQINSADLQGLVDLYETFIGFDPFEEGETDESVRATLLDYVKEGCYEMGVHVSEAGL